MNPSSANQKNLLIGEILIVDDAPANLRLLTTMLTEQGYGVRPARNGELALMSARAVPPDLILLDIKMPDLNGYEVCEQLKADPRTRPIPIIFLSSLDQTEDKVKAFTLGGVDYITKPFQFEEVLARVEVHLALLQAQQRLAAQNKQLQTQLTQIQELHASLSEQAIRDPLTGLYNRRYMDDILERECARALRRSDPLSIIVIDLDRLKEINDTYGHVTGGDKAIQELAATIQQMCRTDDTVCRYGGDEFLVTLYKTPAQMAFNRALQWKETVNKIKINSPAGEFGITFSAGVAEFPIQGSSGEKTLILADKALYRAKECGRNQVVIYQ
jgi:diguanylate cyclase (GGDEF)-like protein